MKKLFTWLVVGVLGGILGTFIYLKLFPHKIQVEFKDSWMPQYTRVKYSGPGDSNLVMAAQKALAAVVHVKIKSVNTQYYYDPWDLFWGIPKKIEVPVQTFGSGVIISPDGYIVTNYHVVSQGGEIIVVFGNKEEFEARVIGTDPSTDLAILKIDAQNLPYLEWGNSDEVKVGEWVLAAGNPFNLTSTVTLGIVSAKSRSIRIYEMEKKAGKLPPISVFIQTDAAVNPGNSGGALVNARGELIGIVTAIQSPTGVYAGYAFAIPSNVAKKVAHDIINYGEVKRAFLGIILQDIDTKLKKENGLATTRGVFVSSIIEGGAAQKAGIRPGDIILSIDNKEVNTAAEIQEIIAQYYPGDKVKVSIIRGTKNMDIEATLQSISGEREIRTASSGSTEKFMGMTLVPLPEDEAQRLNITGGVKVSRIDPSSKFSYIGIKENFIITRINRKEVRTPSDVIKELSNSRVFIIEGIYPDGTTAIYGSGT